MTTIVGRIAVRLNFFVVAIASRFFAEYLPQDCRMVVVIKRRLRVLFFLFLFPVQELLILSALFLSLSHSPLS